jgi:hypothetical protein
LYDAKDKLEAVKLELQRELEVNDYAKDELASKAQFLQQTALAAVEETSKLASHNNQKQKIMLHMKVKKENHELQLENLKLQHQLTSIKKVLEKDSVPENTMVKVLQLLEGEKSKSVAKKLTGENKVCSNYKFVYLVYTASYLFIH